MANRIKTMLASKIAPVSDEESNVKGHAVPFIKQLRNIFS